MENCGKQEGRSRGVPGAMAMKACSACAGEYEDPDRTAPPVEDDAAENEIAGADANKEPAEGKIR